MTNYRVTTVLEETKWRRFLRWLRINRKGEFQITLNFDGYEENELIHMMDVMVRVIRKKSLGKRQTYFKFFSQR